MNRAETLKIMSMLSAFYGQGKADANTMASAWHLILKDYDYHLAERAVLKFARHDVREYATFPAVGSIVRAIENEQKIANRIFNSIYEGRMYETLPEDAKELITEENYKQGLAKDKQELLAEREKIIEALQGRQKRPMLEG